MPSTIPSTTQSSRFVEQQAEIGPSGHLDDEYDSRISERNLKQGEFAVVRSNSDDPNIEATANDSDHTRTKKQDLKEFCNGLERASDRELADMHSKLLAGLSGHREPGGDDEPIFHLFQNKVNTVWNRKCPESASLAIAAYAFKVFGTDILNDVQTNIDKERLDMAIHMLFGTHAPGIIADMAKINCQQLGQGRFQLSTRNFVGSTKYAMNLTLTPREPDGYKKLLLSGNINSDFFYRKSGQDILSFFRGSVPVEISNIFGACLGKIAANNVGAEHKSLGFLKKRFASHEKKAENKTSLLRWLLKQARQMKKGAQIYSDRRSTYIGANCTLTQTTVVQFSTDSASSQASKSSNRKAVCPPSAMRDAESEETYVEPDNLLASSSTASLEDSQSIIDSRSLEGPRNPSDSSKSGAGASRAENEHPKPEETDADRAWSEAWAKVQKEQAEAAKLAKEPAPLMQVQAVPNPGGIGIDDGSGIGSDLADMPAQPPVIQAGAVNRTSTSTSSSSFSPPPREQGSGVQTQLSDTGVDAPAKRLLLLPNNVYSAETTVTVSDNNEVRPLFKRTTHMLGSQYGGTPDENQIRAEQAMRAMIEQTLVEWPNAKHIQIYESRLLSQVRTMGAEQTIFKQNKAAFDAALRTISAEQELHGRTIDYCSVHVEAHDPRADLVSDAILTAVDFTLIPTSVVENSIVEGREKLGEIDKMRDDFGQLFQQMTEANQEKYKDVLIKWEKLSFEGHQLRDPVNAIPFIALTSMLVDAFNHDQDLNDLGVKVLDPFGCKSGKDRTTCVFVGAIMLLRPLLELELRKQHPNIGRFFNRDGTFNATPASIEHPNGLTPAELGLLRHNFDVNYTHTLGKLNTGKATNLNPGTLTTFFEHVDFVKTAPYFLGKTDD